MVNKYMIQIFINEQRTIRTPKATDYLKKAVHTDGRTHVSHIDIYIFHIKHIVHILKDDRLPPFEYLNKTKRSKVLISGTELIQTDARSGFHEIDVYKDKSLIESEDQTSCCIEYELSQTENLNRTKVIRILVTHRKTFPTST